MIISPAKVKSRLDMGGLNVMTDVAADVELVRSKIAKDFEILDIQVRFDMIEFKIRTYPDIIDTKFDTLRKDLKDEGFIPFLQRHGGEYRISVVRMPKVHRRSIIINVALLAVTFITTALAGMLLWQSYISSSQFFTLDNFIYGSIFFALPVMAILGFHEYSHYLMSKRCGVEASLPYFIPFIPPLGTMGAFISLREPMPDRKALVKIGAAGPIGGFLVAVPIAILGLWLTATGHPSSGMIGGSGATAIILQPIYQLFALIFPTTSNMAIHPLMFAAWVGFLVTAINLLPMGQLDGGHIARGLFGDNAKWISYGCAIVLLLLSLFYEGWIFFVLLVLLLGLRHPAPLNDTTKLDKRAKIMGAVCIVMIFVTFVPQPLVAVSPNYNFNMATSSSMINTSAGSVVDFYIYVNDTGNTNTYVSLSLQDIPSAWQGSLYLKGSSNTSATSSLNYNLSYGASSIVVVEIDFNGHANDGSYKMELIGTTQSGSSVGPLQLQVNVS